MNRIIESTDPRERETGQIVRSIRLIRNAHRRYSAELSRTYGMTGQQLGALNIVAHHPGISVGELGERMYLHISTCSGIVDRLERKGYVIRRRSREDRRVVRLHVTPRGRRAAARIPISGFVILMRDMKKLSEGEIHQICGAMKILMRVMKLEWIQEKEVGNER